MSIADDGPGIPAVDRARIYERFTGSMMRAVAIEAALVSDSPSGSVALAQGRAGR